MQTGLSLRQLAQKIASNKETKQDYIADSEKLTMQIRGDSETRYPVLELFGIAKELPLLDLAHNQIGARLGIPAKYYDKMLTERPDLLAMNVNTWLKKGGETKEKRMVRVMHGKVRAFLSNRYNRIENEEIAEVVLPILSTIPGVKILSCEITDRRMYIQAVSPKLEGEVKKGDIIQGGVVVSNSEVGAGSVSVAGLDYRLRCLNGMISSEKFRAYHVGRHIEDDAQLWADDTRMADDRAVLLKVRDMVQNAVDETRFRARIEKMKVLAGLTSANAGDPTKSVEFLAKKVGVSDEERGGILRSLIEGGDLSAWGFLNAVTAQAHKSRSYDRSIELEAAGGQLLELNKKEWTQVLEAA